MKKRQSKHAAEVRLIGINDPHFTAHNPASWKVNYLEELEAAMAKLFLFAKQEDVDAIVWGGDLFHLKSSMRNPHWFVARMGAMLLDLEIPQLCIGGNHDLKYGSLDGLEGQPLEVMLKLRVMNLLDTEDWMFEAGPIKVQVAGRSYKHGLADGMFELKKDPSATYLLGVGHFWFGKQTGMLFGENIYGPDLLMKAEPDVFLIGHHHEDQGIIRQDGKVYCSQGSATRTGTHKQDLERIPSAVYLKINAEGVDATVLRLPCRPASEVFDLEIREQIMQEKKTIEAFSQELADVIVLSTDPRDILKELDPNSTIKAIVEHYLELAEAKC